MNIKIEKTPHGFLRIRKDADDAIVYVLNNDLFLQPKNSQSIYIGKTIEGHVITIKVAEVVSLNGVDYSGSTKTVDEFITDLDYSLIKVAALMSDYTSIKVDSEYEAFVDLSFRTNVLFVRTIEGGGTITKTFSKQTAFNGVAFDTLWTGRAGLTYKNLIEIEF